MPYQLIDTHLHIWNLDKLHYSWLQGDTSILNQTYELIEIEQQMHYAGVNSAILVQAANTAAETQFLLNNAQRSNLVRGVVGWTDLLDPEKTAAFLDTAREKHPLLKGVRHLNHDEENPFWLEQPQVLESLAVVAEKGFTFDVLATIPQHLGSVKLIGEQVPNLKMVLDHLGNQIYFAKGAELWEDLLGEAAENQNLYAKISGIGTSLGHSSWSAHDIHDLILRSLNLFGAERVFCGGDWPVSLLAGSYEHTWQQYLTTLEELLNREEYPLVFHKNAEKFYRL